MELIRSRLAQLASLSVHSGTWLVLRVPRQYTSTQTGLLGQAEMADGVDLTSRCPTGRMYATV
jgi:hypothetical protein